MPPSIRLGGHEIEIKDEDELVEANAIILTVRVEDLPSTPIPSDIVQCMTCEKDVWISKRASKPMYDRGLRAMCMQCVTAMKEPGAEA